MSALTKLTVAEARDALRKVNAELRATQALLADNTRIAERVRILRSMQGASFQDYERGFASVTGKRGVLPRSALEDPHAGAGLRVQGPGWRGDGAAGVAAATGAETTAQAVPTAAAAPCPSKAPNSYLTATRSCRPSASGWIFPCWKAWTAWKQPPGIPSSWMM